MWWRSNHGFSVKSSYQVLKVTFVLEVQVEESTIQLLGMLWTINVLSKILVFGWRLLLNSLPTCDALTIRGIISGSNSLCCSFVVLLNNIFPIFSLIVFFYFPSLGADGCICRFNSSWMPQALITTTLVIFSKVRCIRTLVCWFGLRYVGLFS